jgi:hypothetical protein
MAHIVTAETAKGSCSSYGPYLIVVSIEDIRHDVLKVGVQ